MLKSLLASYATVRLVHCYDTFCILNVVDFRRKAHQQTNKQTNKTLCVEIVILYHFAALFVILVTIAVLSLVYE